MDINEILYVGINAQVLALDLHTGKEIWRTRLRSLSVAGDSFVNVVLDRETIFAHTLGRLYCLDAETGRIKWKNNLDGCGYGIPTFATVNLSTNNVPAIGRKKLVASAASAAAATSGAAAAAGTVSTKIT